MKSVEAVFLINYVSMNVTQRVLTLTATAGSYTHLVVTRSTVVSDIRSVKTIFPIDHLTLLGHNSIYSSAN